MPHAESDRCIELEGVEVTVQARKGLLGSVPVAILRGVSLAIDRAETLAVVGESGSGKTTLARLLLGLLTPSQGEVRYRGQELAAMSRREWQVFRREVQAIFQDPYEVYNPFYRVDHVLGVPVAKFRLVPGSAYPSSISPVHSTFKLSAEQTYSA